MKVLIWCGMLFLAGLLNTMVSMSTPQPSMSYSYNEVMQQSFVSALFPVLIVWLCVMAAKSLCLQWDVSCLKKKAGAEGVSLFQYVARDISPEILQELEKMEGRYDNTNAYLKKCRSQRLLTKPQAKILEDAYVSGMYKTVESGCGNRTGAKMPQKTVSAGARDSGISEEKSGIQLTRHSRSGHKN